MRTAVPRPFESLGRLLSSHRAVTRLSLAALSFVILAAFSQQATIQAGPEPAPLVPESLLPQSIGRGVSTDATVTVPFDTAMDRASVEASLSLLPDQKVELSWNDSGTELTISPERRWRADERYLVVVGRTAATAKGANFEHPERYSFTTEPAPAITDFQLHVSSADTATQTAAEAETLSSRTADAPPATVQPPTETVTEVSATTSVTISFSAAMDQADVESRFAIAPEVAGDLTWEGGELVFTPSERLVAGARYTISVNGAHDRRGNPLGGELNFSFIVQDSAQLITTNPKPGASDVEPATVEMWFSQPMDVDATNEAFALIDTTTGAPVGGHLVWNEAGTQVIYTPDRPLAGGRTFEVTVGDGGLDAAGNAVTASWSFTTKAAPVTTAERSSTAASTRSTSTVSAPVIPPPAPASDAAGYAVNQINAARAAYGFGPVVLDSTISAVAYAHAYDQAINNYFSHVGLDGSTRESRLRAGGVSFGWSGENQCYLVGRSVTATLDWCHSAFMAEPYPGYWNHIANVLNPNAHRVGVGIAQVGSKIVIVWDFTD